MGNIPLPALAVRPPEQTDLMGNVSKLMAMKSMMQQQQGQQQEIQLRQQQIADSQATTNAMRKWDGKDYDALAKSVIENGGSANAATMIQQHGLTIKKTVSDIAKQDSETGSKNLETYIGTHKAIGDALEGIERVPDDQLHQKAIETVQSLAKAGIMDPSAAQQALAGIQQVQDPKALRDHIDQFAKTSLGAKAVAEEEKNKAETEQKKAQTSVEMATAQQKQQESAYYAAHGGAPGVPLERQEADAWLAKPENKGKTLADYKKYTATLVPAFNFNLANAGTTGNAGDVAKRFGMSPTAFDQAAEKYRTSGVLPPSGRGGPALALNKAIMNRAAELHPNDSLAANSAEYKANSESLRKIQTNFDQVSAFESTANKNLALFLKKLEAIPDLGVKFLNTPMRLIDSKMIGSDNYQAMKAAQQTASTETAKVLASANASGVLSDSQKKDAEDVVSGNLSLSAARKVVETIQQDFGNRHQSYADQIADIKRRLGGTEQQDTPPPSGGGSGKAVSLSAARQLPQNKGKTDEEIKADIQKYGHTVAP